MKKATKKKSDPLKTAWLRSPKYHDVIVTVSKLGTKGEVATGDFWVQYWVRKGRSLCPRISTFVKSKGKGVERALGDQVCRFLEAAEFEQANPGVLPTEENYRSWLAANKAKHHETLTKTKKA